MRIYLTDTITLDITPIIFAIPNLLVIPIFIYVVYLSFKASRAKIPGSKLIFWGLISHFIVGNMVDAFPLYLLGNIQEPTQTILLSLLSLTPILILIIPVIGFKKLVEATITNHD